MSDETKLEDKVDNQGGCQHKKAWGTRMWSQMWHRNSDNEPMGLMIIIATTCCVIATICAIAATMYLGSIVKLLTRFVYMCAYFDRSTCWI